tara:strand:+ start:58 stop:519 length:462 start_codon:yes stop_codon:yes gene_type:complete
MSTNSRIGIRLPDDSILSVYHHWDGYPEWLGVTLKQQYNTREKVEELIDGGNMSSCYSDNTWDIDVKCDPRPLYYTERGESLDDNAPKLSKNEKEYLVTTDKCCGEFAYIFELNNTWRCIELRFWDSVTGQFYDKFDSQERNIPDNYPQELAA